MTRNGLLRLGYTLSLPVNSHSIVLPDLRASRRLQDITGKNGLLKELTKAILERALEAETTV
jgi:hypothetical protein